MNKWLKAFRFACFIVAISFAGAALVFAQFLYLEIWGFAALGVELIALLTFVMAGEL